MLLTHIQIVEYETNFLNSNRMCRINADREIDIKPYCAYGFFNNHRLAR